MSVRKKKHVLSLENEFNFDLIGIVSNHSDYRLVWGINQLLGFHLEKSEQEFDVFDKKTGNTVGHPLYDWISEDDGVAYHLIKNKVASSTLINEKPVIDYFLFISTEAAFDIDGLLSALKKVESVLGAYIFDPSEIESCEMFDF